MGLSIEIKGTIHSISDGVQITDKFSKRDFVVSVIDNNYTQHIQMQFVNDKTMLLDGYVVGDSVLVGVNIQGREVRKDGKTYYFNSLNAWKIQKEGRQYEKPSNPPIIGETPDFDEAGVPF